MKEIRFMPHQLEALEKLRSGSILCGGVGTGKSITAIGYYFLFVCDGIIFGKLSDGQIGTMKNPKDLYIITTARKRDTHEWEKELDRFDISSEPVKVTIDSWNNINKYQDVTDAFFIFDEQRVVGSGAWVKAFIKISKMNQWILLSATPGDTWMDYIPVFVANGFYRNRTEFLRRHAVYSRYTTFPKVQRWIETGRLENLRRRITVTMEYEKQTVPHWNDIVVTYDQKLYDEIAVKRWDPWEKKPIEDIAKACYLMRKAVNDNEQRARKLFWLVLAKHPKVIVFYNYDYEKDLIKNTFAEMMGEKGSFDFTHSVTSDVMQAQAALLDEDYDFDISEWNGHKHEPIPKTKKWVYLVHYAAGAEGWNCIETDTSIFFSQSYSYKMMTQAAGRIDRLNTPFTDLYYYVFKTAAPIDKAIDRALRAKKNFNERLFKW